MKTIVSLALAGLMSISALLPALAAQEAENVSIPENSGISESVAQDESSVSSSCSTADESTEPESGSNAEDGSDSVSQPESGSMPVESDSSTSVGSKAETGSSLPASDSMTSDEMDADSEPASGNETAESDANAEDSLGVTAATADEQTVPVTVSEEYGAPACGQPGGQYDGPCRVWSAAAPVRSPRLPLLWPTMQQRQRTKATVCVWEAMNAAFEQLGAQGCTAGQLCFHRWDDHPDAIGTEWDGAAEAAPFQCYGGLKQWNRKNSYRAGWSAEQMKKLKNRRCIFWTSTMRSHTGKCSGTPHL